MSEPAARRPVRSASAGDTRPRRRPHRHPASRSTSPVEEVAEQGSAREGRRRPRAQKMYAVSIECLLPFRGTATFLRGTTASCSRVHPLGNAIPYARPATSIRRSLHLIYRRTAGIRTCPLTESPRHRTAMHPGQTPSHNTSLRARNLLTALRRTLPAAPPRGARAASTDCGGRPIIAPAAAGAQSGADDGEWRYYGGDAGSTRYAPLDQIDRDNVGRSLEIAWRWQAANFGPATGIQLPDHAAHGGRRACTPRRGTVAPSWRSTPARARRCGPIAWTKKAGRRPAATRDVASPGGNRPATGPRIFLVTPGFQLVALDAATGRPSRLRRWRRGRVAPRDWAANCDLVRAPIGSSSPPTRGRRCRRGGVGDCRRAARPLHRRDAAGPRARLRRGHRRAPVDLPHHSAARRVRQRHLGGRLLGVHRQRSRLDRAQRRPRTRLRLPSRRTGHRRLLRRPPPRRQPVSRRASLRSTPPPANASGTSRRSATASGTTTPRRPPSWPT